LRSEIWGFDWKEKHGKEGKDEAIFQRLKKLSDQKLLKRDELKKDFIK
jgi:hypothetical protein